MTAPSPLISILIPTFNYAEGLERIFRRLGTMPHNVEIIVFDDSQGLEVKNIVDRWGGKLCGLRYRHNFSIFGKALGACANWNDLIDSAKGEYVLLMHHDEAPASPDFLASLCATVQSRRDVDVWLFNLVIWDEGIARLRRHTDTWLRTFILKHHPSFLFRRNVIGPTATVLIRRVAAPRFDPELRRKIDTEFYVKLFRPGISWSNANDIAILSVYRTAGSITAEIWGDIKNIVAEEHKSLRVKHKNASLWLGSPLGLPIRLIETIAWAMLRAANAARDILWKAVDRLGPPT